MLGLFNPSIWRLHMKLGRKECTSTGDAEACHGSLCACDSSQCGLFNDGTAALAFLLVDLKVP